MAVALGLSASRQLLSLAADATCKSGLLDCKTLSGSRPPSSLTVCAPYDGKYVDTENNYWLLIASAAMAAVFAFGIGGNDGANAWGTTIHSLAIRLRPAVLLAGIFEILGATTLGYGVSSAIQTGISDVTDNDCFACGRCDSSMTLYYTGMLAALIGGSIFLLTATYFRMPVSTTHTIVAAVLGMTVAFHGFGCIKWGWHDLGGIIASWVISPILSGVICLAVYYATHISIFQAESPRTRTYMVVPLLYFVVVWVMAFLAIIKAPTTEDTPRWKAVWISTMIAGGVALLVVVVLLPHLKRNLPSVNPKNKLDMERLMKSDALKAAGYDAVQTPAVGEPEGDQAKGRSSDDFGMKRESDPYLIEEQDRASLMVVAEYELLTEEQQDAMWMFKYVLILAACLQSFAHGANDTANATAAFEAVRNGFRHGYTDCAVPETPWWVMLLGSAALAVGIYVWGYRVMETVGRNIAIVNFHRAFCTEFASSLTVVVASILNLPVSSTHCQVGAVVFVSMAAVEWRKINWSLLLGVLLAWLLTLPVSALLAALAAYLLKYAVKA
jgi:solute carrier family 20 (sodium-dependent phosphate transporter)